MAAPARMRGSNGTGRALRRHHHGTRSQRARIQVLLQFRQLVPQIRRGLVPVRRILHQAMPDDATQLRWHRRIDYRDRRRRVLENRRQHADVRVAAERPLPVAISYKMTPSENRSDRASTRAARRLLGRHVRHRAEHAAFDRSSAPSRSLSRLQMCGDGFVEPRDAEVEHLDAAFVIARPIMMLAGFRSRCVMPLACAAAIASASGIAIVSSSASGRPPLGIATASDRPSISSIVRNRTSSDFSTECTVTMFG